jgi:folate-binding protein YgfZ
MTAFNVSPSGTTRRGDLDLPAAFSGLSHEYEACRSGLGIHDRSYRGLIEATGADRHAWLHNLNTNEVKNLQPGDGNYAFAVNVKGRILFDMNVIVAADRLWLDVERRFATQAVEHLNKYIIMEDVATTDRTADFVRVGVLGKGLAAFGDGIGLSNLAAMSQLQSATFNLPDSMTIIRHDFAGVRGAELFIPAAAAEKALAQLMALGAGLDMTPVGLDAVEILRIESGIPWMGADIDNDVLPGETLQGERAISFQKGCYLGQEVVERMRSRGSLAKQLVGLAIDGDEAPAGGAELRIEDKPVGRLTSVRRSARLNALIGLGYLRSAHAKPDQAVTIAGEREAIFATVTALPFISPE